MCVPVLDIKINSLKYLFLIAQRRFNYRLMYKTWKNSVNSFVICIKDEKTLKKI